MNAEPSNTRRCPSQDQHLQLEVLEPESLWWIDSTSGHLRVRYNVLDPNKEWCICDDGHALQACLCDASFQKKDFWLFEQGVIRASSGTKCLQADKTLAVATCPNGRDLKLLGRVSGVNMGLARC